MGHQLLSVRRMAGGMLALAMGVLVASGACLAGNWPQWRGPSATGHTDERSLPITWGGKDGANVLWKAKLSDGDDARSSPIVWGERVYVTTTKGFAHRVGCYGRADGRLLWHTPIEPGPLQKSDYRMGGVSAPTPATDGRRVYVVFGTAVMAALSCDDGKVVWSAPLAKYAFDVAIGSSPIVWGDSVILFSGLTDKQSNLAAFDGQTGQVKWETVWPEVGFGHSTPAFATVGGQVQLIVSVNDKKAGVRGVDPASGKLLWSGPGDGETASPAVGADAVYCDSGRGGGGYTVDLPKAGAASVPLKWSLRRVPMELGSPIVVGGHVYRLGAGGKLLCLRLRDGEEAGRQELPGASRWASPVATPEGRLYYATAGKSYVIQAGPKCEILAVNDLGDPEDASAAVSDGMIFLKGRKHLFCIAAGSTPAATKPPASGDQASKPEAPKADAPPGPQPAGQWVSISDGFLAEVQAQGLKPSWPGKTTGVAVDRTTGHVYMIVTGLGVWRSSDQGATFRRVDGKTVSGRCETGYSLRADPAGKRLACFMLDGKSAMTADAGATWSPIKNVARGFDWAAVDWSQKDIKTIFGLVHESGGIGIVTQDGGRSWKQLGKGYFAVGVFGADVLVCAKAKERGIWRSTDGGEKWQKVSEATPVGVATVFQGAGYWLSDQGLLASRDRGSSWPRVCGAAGASWGPFFGKDANHFVVVDKQGFEETTDGGRTWKLIAPLPAPFRKDYNPRGWFVNVAWDPLGKVCYASRMGQPTYRCRY
jgi:outer membrane protein assembly factor BamB